MVNQREQLGIGDRLSADRAIVATDAGAVFAVARPQRAEEHPAVVYLLRLAPGSRRTMRHALDTIAATLTNGQRDALTLEWSQLRYQHTAAIRAVLAERYGPATTNKTLAALRGVLKEAWRLGLMEAADYQRAVDLPGVRNGTLPRGRALTPGELRALFTTCADGSPAGVRDAALLAVLYGGGLRRAEVVSLDMSDYLPASGALTIRHGKGEKARIVYLTGGAQAAMGAWCALWGEAAGPLFLPINKGGRITARRMTDQAILAMLQRCAMKAGVGHFSPHDLRRTFISDLLDAGADIATVQKLAGHSSVATTGRYDRRGEHAKQRAAALLHVPYQG